MSQNGGQLSAAAFESQRLFSAVDALGSSVAERLADWDRNQELDRQAFTDAAATGLTGVEVPKYLGGLGLGFRQKVQAAEILGRHSMAYAFSVINTHNVAAKLAEIGSASHKRDLLPELLAGRRVGSTALTEPQAGSDFGAITTHAQRQGNQWLLNGEKAWITNASVSDVIICYAQTEPQAGSRGIASFLIDGRRSGFHRVAPYRLSGSHMIGTGGFRLENYRAEAEDLLTEPGDGFRTALAGVNGARVYVAALCCAMVHSALVTATQYGAERTTFGQPLLKHQGLAWSLASVANKLEAARLLTDRAIDLIDRGESDEIILAAAHAKKFATEMAEPAIIACIQSMGAEGLRDRYPLGRHLADARVANFVDGSTEIQTERIARSLTKVYQHRSFDPPLSPPPMVADGPPQGDVIAPPSTVSDTPPPPTPATAWAAPEPPVNHAPDGIEPGEPAGHRDLPGLQDDPEQRAGGWFDSPDLDTTELADGGLPEAPVAAFDEVTEEPPPFPPDAFAGEATDGAPIEEIIDAPPPMPPGAPPLPPDSLRTERQ